MPHAYQDKSRGIRLQKAMADAGVASRRDCEQLVLDGRVTVNGEKVAELPAWVDPVEDALALDGQPLRKPGATNKKGRPRKRTYLMLNKPKRVISTTDDPDDRPTVTDLLDGAVRARVFPVGRLDSESTGLILLTDDGDLAARLTHPRYEVAKRYLVDVRGELTDEDLQPLRDGLMLTQGKNQGGGKTTTDSPKAKPGKTSGGTSGGGGGGVKRAAMESVAIVKRTKDREKGHRTQIAVTLTEGQNREIRRLLARRGIKVRSLKRVAIGPVKLKGLAIGQWRPLTRQELQALRRAAGLG